MAIESQNIYKNARKSAGFTQEKASQLLNVSVDSLRDYEQSQRPVPSDVASAMCDVYQAPYLAVQHLRLTSDLGKRVVPEIQLKDLPEAVLGVLAAVQRFCAKREAMVEIAADGQIAESEQAEWDEIMCLANDLNLSKINVAVGQKLKPGDLIGVEGSTGHSTGSHLHWEIRINDISTGYVSVHQYAGIPNVAGSTAYTSNWVAELFGPSNLKKSTSGFPQRLYNSVLQGALGIDKDGIFGANTEKTVKEFQSAHGLTADGIAGAKTKAALAKQL